MTFEEAAMIMMSGGGSSAPSPLSLEGIKALKTLGTVTIGDFIFEIKEPKLFYAGEIYYNSYKEKYWRSPWLFSVVLNQSVAAVNNATSNTFEYYEWDKNPAYGNGDYFSYGSDFVLSSVTVGTSYLYMPSLRVDFQYTSSRGYVGDKVISSTYTGGQTISFQYQSPTFTNLSNYDYFTLAKSCIQAAQVNTPVIKIL